MIQYEHVMEWVLEFKILIFADSMIGEVEKTDLHNKFYQLVFGAVLSQLHL